MRRIAASVVLALLLTGLLAAAPALAQTDARALFDRIDRLERDLSILQAQSARGTAPVRPPMPAAGVSDGSVAGSMASRLDDRINELEDMVRHLTGKLEEANFKSAQLVKQMERMQADIDLRFKEIQAPAAQAAAPAAAPPAPGATLPSGAPALIPPKGMAPGSNSADGTGPAPGPQVLGTMPEKDLKKALAKPPVEPPPPVAARPAAPAAPKDPQAAYDDAYTLAQKGDYEGAERAFQAFLKAHPTHQLAGNAQYWLGDIAFSQKKDFAQAAKLFGEAYKKYPKHTKAPDMLFKLGASFGHLEMKDQACRTYALLFAEHPGMADRIKRAAASDKQKLGCK